ncbi:ATP-binding cassette domain-containing protein [Paraglaciecola sp. MB-3u-78]|uniref:ABC transporter ATP-binding protein n=1 Tax=Paraglaciecola sp. MB-3u-78 TaxID=2058332 RepID=UPI001E6296D7|nr:ATP-binding cassette domain-containing protein [Paraglaciecola sp. MB-3u-78]
MFEKISHYYQNRCVFNDFSLEINEPRVLISGPNGSGKTTLLMLAAGLIKPDAGKVSFNQQSVLMTASKQYIGISASKVALPGFLTVAELLDFHQRQFNCEPDEHWLTQFGLKQYWHTKVDNLSLGNHKKLSLLTAVMHQPPLLLLDEPANGLDDKARLALNLLLRDYPGQVMIASHEGVAEKHQQVRHIQLQRSEPEPA